MPAITKLRRTIRQATPALALGTAALTATLAACSDSPTAPASTAPTAARAIAQSPSHYTSPTATSGSALTTAMLTPWFSFSQAQLDALMADLAAYRAAVVPIPSAGIVSSTGPTADDAEAPRTATAGGTALACRAEHGWSDTQTIDARGGTLHIGPHRFTVPAGALDHAVTITATSTGSTTRGLDFAPHGLRFLRPVSMTISFAGCSLPEDAQDAELGVVYTDPSTGRPVQRMPAHADHPAHQITALTDHFSGYLVSTGRN